ncbi:N-acetylmuramoyl-L-alanine amidase [Balneolales bacterium ANBcel1]|nr:N-acetylmuramoyl-L-alanine amidase [Balneolales bacterium ANBcel1]
MFYSDRPPYPVFAVLVFALFTYALTHLHSTAPFSGADSDSVNPAASIPDGSPGSASSSSRLEIVIPETDSIRVNQSRHRVAGNTHPANRVTIDGTEARVFPSGAFAGIIELPTGYSRPTVQAVTPEGDTLLHEFHFYRDKPADSVPESLPADPVHLFDESKAAEVVGKHAFVTSGSDRDRLGGRIVGYLDEGILLEITARQGGFYRIRLSDRRKVYIPVRFVRILHDAPPMPRPSTGSVSLTSDDRTDVVSLTVGARLPWIATMQTNPNAIEVDIFGTEADVSRALSEPGGNEAILDIQLTDMGDGHARLRIVLAHDLHWGFHAGYGIGQTLRIGIRRPPGPVLPDTPLEGRTIAIDPGHGGSNFGARGATGALEKDVALEISKRIQRNLERNGASVVMTRSEDTVAGMPQRIDRLLASDADVLLSIHANSVSYAVDPLNIRGTSTYYRYREFRPFAQAIHSHMTELPLHNFGLIGNFNFTLNAMTAMPNVLVETAFLSHPEDEMKLLDPDFQDQIAEQLTLALMRFFREHGKPAAFFPLLPGFLP